MFGPDEGEPQTGDGRVGRAAVRLQRRFHAVQPLGRFAHARDGVDARRRARRRAAEEGAPRAHVSEEEARKPRPDLPPEQRALLVTGEPGHPEERWIDAEAAEAAGYTLVDLSRRLDAVHLRRADDARRAAAAQPLPPHLPRPGQRPARRGRRAARARATRTTSSSTASSRRCRCCARASSRTNSTPATTRRASRRSRRSRPSPTSRPPTSRRTSASWRRCARSWRRRAARRRSRRSRSWPRSSRRSRPR